MSTSIAELPNELNIENNHNNISMIVQEKNKIVPSMNIREDISVEQSQSNTIQKDNMSDILSGLKKLLNLVQLVCKVEIFLWTLIILQKIYQQDQILYLVHLLIKQIIFKMRKQWIH